MLIRSERSDDVSAIAALISDAFGGDDRRAPVPEVTLVSSLRASPAWIGQQSQVAVVDDEIVGHCLCSRAAVGTTPALALGPIAVMASHQRRGIGSALMRNAIDIAVDMGEPLIGLLGDYDYYGRFGFVSASSIGIIPPDPAWGHYFQVLTLPAYRGATGRFTYPGPFRALSGDTTD